MLNQTISPINQPVILAYSYSFSEIKQLSIAQHGVSYGAHGVEPPPPDTTLVKGDHWEERKRGTDRIW